jgi:hypothetical protein
LIPHGDFLEARGGAKAVADYFFDSAMIENSPHPAKRVRVTRARGCPEIAAPEPA